MDGGDERDVGFCWLGDALSEPLITLIFVMGCDGRRLLSFWRKPESRGG